MSGEEVKRILAAHGITQRELAASLGTSPQNIGSQLSKDDVKTGHLYSIRIEPEAQEILDRWRGETHLLAVFDRYRKPNEYNRRLAEALKRIAGPDGKAIEPDCSGNWARHTWATMAAELDIPEATISWALGHVPGHRTTQIYIRRSDAKCDEANRLVIDYMKGTVPHFTAQDGTS